MKIKYIIYGITVILAISGIWTIEEEPTILGIASVLSMCFIGLYLVLWLIDNRDTEIYKN